MFRFWGFDQVGWVLGQDEGMGCSLEAFIIRIRFWAVL